MSERWGSCEISDTNRILCISCASKGDVIKKSFPNCCLQSRDGTFDRPNTPMELHQQSPDPSLPQAGSLAPERSIVDCRG